MRKRNGKYQQRYYDRAATELFPSCFHIYLEGFVSFLLTFYAADWKKGYKEYWIYRRAKPTNNLYEGYMYKTFLYVLICYRIKSEQSIYRFKIMLVESKVRLEIYAGFLIAD